MFSKKAIEFFNNEPSGLTFVLTKVKILQELTQCLSPYIDSKFSSYYQVANLNNGKLILIAANASVATQLRYLSVDLLKKFSTDPKLKHIKQMECKVRPEEPNKKELIKKNMPALSLQTAEMIEHIALNIEHDPLQSILKRIAARTLK